MVKERANELRVFGIPICKPNSDDKTKAVWTIESFEKKEISFTEVACHDGCKRDGEFSHFNYLSQ